MKSYRVIGLMSGSSLDGLDVAYVQFQVNGASIEYDLLKTGYFPFPELWKSQIRLAERAEVQAFLKTHHQLGAYFGELVSQFIHEENIGDELDFIASHGQTIFHSPRKGFTTQIGDGAAIAAKTGYPVICDFRSTDVAFGGQGTPIAPVADKYLFPEYSHCLNLGGFANISFKRPDGSMIGYDICAVNMALNFLAEEARLKFDRGGEMARTGKVQQQLLEQLKSLPFYKKLYPKSLGAEWFEREVRPLLSNTQYSLADRMATVCEQIAFNMAQEIERIYNTEKVERQSSDKMLITGGGAHHTFLVERVKAHSPVPVMPASDEIIDFKEAILMALMGVLRVENMPNCLASVTGAGRDSVGGAIYQGWKKML